MDNSIFIKQLDDVISTFENLKRTSSHSDLSDHPKFERQSLISRTIAAIERIVGENSTYFKEVKRIIDQNPALHTHTTSIIGIALALREDLKNDYLKSFEEIVHADIFSDFIEMAEHLLSNGYKDPSAVIIGSTLEGHLKKMALKNEIEIETDGRPFKAERINQELAKAGVYNLLTQKSITAWLDLRNKAAHGNYSEYTKEQVNSLISSVRDFITKYPA
ncbi:MAG: S9 family peptidase [Flavobacterium sp.]|nr:S9 family peptidase [Flavobacterium sp.]